MTVRIAHQTHRWDHRTAECRLCGCSSATLEAQALCLKADMSALPKKGARAPGVPDLHKHALDGARDLVRK